jgi:transposase
MTRVELYERIRREHLVHGKSIRQVAREQHVHRRDVRRAISGQPPPARKIPRRSAAAVGPHREVIDEWLLADRKVPPKQRHTNRRIWERLRQERGFGGAESTIRRYVGGRRRELGLAVREQEVFIDQEHEPGQEAEVDFGEAEVVIGGVPTLVFLLLMRCCFSGYTQAVAFRRQRQQSFLEGLCLCFERFGGVFSHVRFDNLSAAVRKVLRGRKRHETDRLVACRSHYLFESVFCRPGKAGAHEKGGVEGEVGRFRRNHLVPIPSFESMDALNDYLQACCEKDKGRHMTQQTATVGERWLLAQKRLRPLPEERFDTSESAWPRVDSRSRVQVHCNFYSVPVAYVGRQVEARVDSETVALYAHGQRVAVHARLHTRFEQSLVLDHYLEWLKRKPGAFANSKVLHQERQRGGFPPCFQRLWSELQERYGESKGTRQLMEVLMLLREANAEEVAMAIELVLSYGCIDSAAVRYTLRQLQTPATAECSPLVDLGALVAYERPEPDLRRYDAWLGKEVH